MKRDRADRGAVKQMNSKVANTMNSWAILIHISCESWTYTGKLEDVVSTVFNYILLNELIDLFNTILPGHISWRRTSIPPAMDMLRNAKQKLSRNFAVIDNERFCIRRYRYPNRLRKRIPTSLKKTLFISDSNV